MSALYTKGEAAYVTQTTTSGTTIGTDTVSIPLNSICQWELQANGMDTAGNGYSIRLSGVTKRGTAGNIAALGSAIPAEFTNADAGIGAAAALVNLNTTSNALEIGVTGVAAKTINWDCRLAYRLSTFV